MTNDVCSEKSSLPVNRTVTVWPANEPTLNDFWLYPAAWFRFEYVASVLPPTFTVSVSNGVTPVVSAVSMCNQNVNVELVHPAGMVTDWDSVSVCVAPYPSSHASHVPECGGSDGLHCPITPAVAVHDAEPDSKPGLASF